LGSDPDKSGKHHGCLRLVIKLFKDDKIVILFFIICFYSLTHSCY